MENTTIEEIVGRQRELYKKMIWGVKDLMEFTGYSRATVYRLTHEKKLPMRKRGNKLYFFPKEILDWINEGDEL